MPILLKKVTESPEGTFITGKIKFDNGKIPPRSVVSLYHWDEATQDYELLSTLFTRGDGLFAFPIDVETYGTLYHIKVYFCFNH